MLLSDINSLPSQYDSEIEKKLIIEVNALEVRSLTSNLADLLAFAISNHYNNLAKEILQKDYQGRRLNIASINRVVIAQNNNEYSLLHFTAQFGNKEMFIYFLNNAIPLSLDSDHFTPLHTITFAKNLNKEDVMEIIALLKELDPHIVNSRDIFHLTPLHYAAHNDNIPALEALIANGATR